jgi:hypothetical protein
MFMGNRGSIHRAPGEIARPWQVRRWITCRLEYKGWVAPKWQPGRWTPLFFWDEAVALAAGHRPCALCRRGDYNAWLDGWAAAFGDRPKADPMDLQLHDDRLDGRIQRHHRRPWPDLPTGTFVAIPTLVPDDQRSPGTDLPDGNLAGGPTSSLAGGNLAGGNLAGGPTSNLAGGNLAGGNLAGGSTSTLGGGGVAVVVREGLVPWTVAGYGRAVARPGSGEAEVLTPWSTVEVLRQGYEPVIHPGSGG